MTMLEPISGQSGVGPHLKKFATKMQIVNNVRHIFCCYTQERIQDLKLRGDTLGYAPNTYARRLESEENQAKIMKIAKPVIVKPITKLINKSISSAKFPDNLKEAITQEK